MRVVVADATPLHYLILIDAVDVLPRLFERIHVPAEVRDEPQKRGLSVTGTLGVLDLASRAGLIHLQDAFKHLQNTNFRYPPSLMEALLEEERNRKK